MKRLLMFAALALAACQPPGPATVRENFPVASTTLLDEKALYAAEASYNLAANAYVTADALGFWKPQDKAKVKPIMIDAYEALAAARSAYALANAKSFYEQAAAAKQLAEDASLLIPRNY